MKTARTSVLRHPKSLPENRRGVAYVEFALVLPILLLLLLGIIELGRGLTVHQILTNGAREGARRAALAGSTDAQVQAAIDNYMTNAGIATGFSRQISPPVASAMPGDNITVTVSLPFSQVFSTPGNWIGMNNVTLTSRVVMRKE